MNISSAGNYIGGSSDQFNFEYQLQTGNFDVTVCLASLGLSDLWAQAGLMARASLDPGSPFSASLATPGMNGDFFEYRTATNGLAAASGSFPSTIPTPGCASIASAMSSAVLAATTGQLDAIGQP